VSDVAEDAKDTEEQPALLGDNKSDETAAALLKVSVTDVWGLRGATGAVKQRD
jgi:hypothetical protein